MKKEYELWAGIRSDTFEYAEKVDIEEEREHFEECKGNGANPHLDNVSFEENIAPGKWTNEELDNINGIHFLYGWMECIGQRSDGSPVHYFPESGDWYWFVEHREKSS